MIPFVLLQSARRAHTSSVQTRTYGQGDAQIAITTCRAHVARRLAVPLLMASLALAGCTAPGGGMSAASRGVHVESDASPDDSAPLRTASAVTISPAIVAHGPWPRPPMPSSVVVMDDDPAMFERAAILAEIVRIEIFAMRGSLDPAHPVDAVTLVELDRLLEHATRVEASLEVVAESQPSRGRRSNDRARRNLAHATTRLSSQWTAFQLRRAEAVRRG